MDPVIVCIAKLESDYILHFVKYHLSIGFKKIYVYDNEDTPVYGKVLETLGDSVVVIHFPGNKGATGVQYLALDHFIKRFMRRHTHVAHIDIDEYIVLKRHRTITEFIKDYFVGDCGAIGMNWRFFGSSGHTRYTDVPVTERFTMCELNGNKHIKTLFRVSNFIRYNNNPHAVCLSKNYKTKATNGAIIDGPFNLNIDFSAVQLNHYKCKTLPEFKRIRVRGDPGFNALSQRPENVEESFKMYDRNEVKNLDILTLL